jgi:hypothetical protein
MNSKGINVKQFIQNLAEREGTTTEKVQEIICSSFRKSYCQGTNEGAVLSFEFEELLTIYRVYSLVDEVIDPSKEIPKDDRILKEGEVRDNLFFFPVNTKGLSYYLIQEIKNELKKDLKEIQIQREYDTFFPLKGEIISGKLKSFKKDYCLVDLGKGWGY